MSSFHRPSIWPGLALIISLSSQAQSIVPSRPDDVTSKQPVVIWAHYMPQVSDAALPMCFHGNNDVWPLNSQWESQVRGYKEHMRLARASGVDGFQVLTVMPKTMLEAARQFSEETGKPFYVAPEWSSDSYESPTRDRSKPAEDVGRKWAEVVAKYAEKVKDEPSTYYYHGRPLFFTYVSGKWERDPVEVAAYNARLRELNCNALLAPTVSLKQLLDRLDLGDYGAWPPGPIQPGPVKFLTTGFDGGTIWDHGPDSRAVEALANRIPEVNPGYLALPTIAAGYDCSNRPSRAIRVPYNGIGTLLETLRTLRDGPKRWGTPPFEQFSLITWNDSNETLFVPSSGNVWGFNTILRYFRGMFENGESPLAKPEVVVAFPVECLYGDSLRFQVLALPAKDETIAVRAKVEWQPVGGGKPFTQQGEASASEANHEAFLQMDWPSAPAVGRIDALQPRLTIELKRAGGEWETAYDHLLLPPVQLTYNVVQFPDGYEINLDKVSPVPLSLKLAEDNHGLTRATVISEETSPIRRLHLERGSRSLGVFREASVGNARGDLVKDLFLRIETSLTKLPLRLEVSKGTIHDLFTRTNDNGTGVSPVNQPVVEFPSYTNATGFWRAGGWRSARVDMDREATITLSVPDTPEVRIVATLPELLKSRLVRTFDYAGKPATIALGLTFDGTDANIDYPLPSAGKFTRELALWTEQEGVQVIHAAALLKSGQMAYSDSTVLLAENGISKKKVSAQWIDTGGTFDDFVRGGFATSYNPFTPEQVRRTPLPRNRVPYFHLDLEEGAGSRLNDRYVEHEAGRAWVETNGASHAAGYAYEDSGAYQWLKKGHQGHALQLSPEAKIRFRSKSAPVGPQTISLWVGMNADGGLDELSAGPFTLTKEAGDAFKTGFSLADEKLSLVGEAKWQPGWNHVVFVYDLAAVRVYVNGALSGETAAPPLNQRTQQSPSIKIAGEERDGLLFDGRIDDIEVIGTGLDPVAVRDLWKGKAWR